MLLTVLIAVVSLVILVSLHELGHFLTAKFFGVWVEEFGVGYPPRLFSRKFGDTLYSLNLLPFGAFVKIPEEPSTNPASFFAKPIWQRALILFNGALSFWLVSFVLFSLVLATGAPTVVNDEEQGLKDVRVQITAISPESPAARAGLKAGDVVTKIGPAGFQIEIDKTKTFQDLVNANKGREIVLTVKRGGSVMDFTITPRVSPPAGQGALGVALARTAIKSYPWYQAPFLGVQTTWNATVFTLKSYWQALTRVFQGAPSGVQLTGPIGIVGLLSQGIEIGFAYFLQMIAILSVNVAVLNLLPIPAFDGGRLFFLGVEAVRKKPVSQDFQEKVILGSFVLLIILMVFVTIKDIGNFRALF